MPQYEHHNPVTGSWLTTNAASQPYMDRQERDPANGQIPLAAPPSNSTYASLNFASPLFIEGGDPFNFSGGHSIDGMPVSDAEFARRTGNGSAVGGIFLDGKHKQIGQVDLTNGRASLSHLTIEFDVFRSLAPALNKETYWVYQGRFAIEFSLQPQLGFLPGISAQQQKTLPAVSKEDKALFRGIIETALKNPKCRDYINKLLGEVKTETNRGYSDVLTAFDQISFYWGNPWFGGQAHNDNGNRWVQISDRFKTERFISKDRTATLTNLTAAAFLNETMHLINTSGSYFSDADYANAVNTIRVGQGLEQPRSFPDRTTDDVWRASMYWHPKLDEKCFPVTGQK